ncbi:MAG: peptidoglycan DD-metalloendopeptidase family protein [Alphaproteobacteria bacterium]|jgi:septal ring factor EnvC (AmiA/AmiB activator)|nr:peptidoglycan DD-metalloendopeptidase family protein [Alphaproteobacteria bacterium]
MTTLSVPSVAFVFFVIALLPLCGHANDSADLRKTEQQLNAKRQEETRLREESAATAAQADSLSGERIRLSALIQEIEQDRTEQQELLAHRHAEMTRAQELLSTSLAASERSLQNLIKLSRQPPLMTLLTPDAASETRQGAALLRWYAEHLQKDVALLNTRLDVLATAEVEHRKVLDRLQADGERLKEQETQLNAQLAEKRRLQQDQKKSAAKLQNELERLAQKEQTLRSFLAELAKKSKAPEEPKKEPDIAADNAEEPATPKEANKTAATRTPVAGRILTRFGQAQKGMTSQGVTYAGAPGALVTSPISGTIVYAGSYGKYGNVVIAEISRGQHLVLAGLGQLIAQSGERLKAGEPVGRLEKSGVDCCKLYVELRKRGTPINPLPYLQRPAS